MILEDLNPMSEEDVPAVEMPWENNDNDSSIRYHIDEVKGMREEINWRVRTAYSSSIIFISAISLLAGTLFGNNNTFLTSIKTNVDYLMISGIVVLLALSAWVGVQNANHLIEKKIELYSLEVLKIIVFKSKNVYCAWLGYLYGADFFKNKVKSFFGKFFNASIGMFMYLLPNLLTLFLWFNMVLRTPIGKYPWSFAFASFFVFVSVGSTFLFFFYVLKVHKEYSAFYKDVLLPYLKKHDPGRVTVVAAP